MYRPTGKKKEKKKSKRCIYFINNKNNNKAQMWLLLDPSDDLTMDPKEKKAEPNLLLKSRLISLRLLLRWVKNNENDLKQD